MALLPLYANCHSRTAQHLQRCREPRLGSVADGCEVVSPILHGQEGVEELKSVVTALDDAGGSVSRVCGLHVHLDGRNFEVRHLQSIVQRYARFEDEIDAFMPPSRRGNQNRYCRTMRELAANENFLQASTVRHLVAAQGGRYFKVNLQPLLSQGSIEFRQHSGTLNSAKIHNWLGFIDGFVRESCRRVDLET